MRPVELIRRPMSTAAAVAQSVSTKFVIIGLNAATGIITARALLPAGRSELAAMILPPVFLPARRRWKSRALLTFS